MSVPRDTAGAKPIASPTFLVIAGSRVADTDDCVAIVTRGSGVISPAQRPRVDHASVRDSGTNPDGRRAYLDQYT